MLGEVSGGEIIEMRRYRDIGMSGILMVAGIVDGVLGELLGSLEW